MLNAPSDPSRGILASPDSKDSPPIHFIVPDSVSKRFCLNPSKLLEQLFEKHGRLVAKYPWIFVGVCFFIALSSSCGLLAFRWENNIVRLWNPTNSETGRNFAWLWKNHPPDLRRHSIIFQADNVLHPDVIKKVRFYPRLLLLCCSCSKVL
jgi:hypothetical protein